MSAATSPTAGRVYGVQRMCAAWAFPRASYYATNPAAPTPAAPGKRGPKTACVGTGFLDTRQRLVRRLKGKRPGGIHLKGLGEGA